MEEEQRKSDIETIVELLKNLTFDSENTDFQTNDSTENGKAED